MSFPPSPNLFSVLSSRSRLPLSHSQSPAQAHPALMERMKLAQELHGHRGCVNRLELNPSATLLASGSDDCRVKIWSADRGRCRVTLKTGHTNNIFGNCFVEDDKAVVSCGMDTDIRLTYLARPSSSSLIFPRCHAGRVKDVCARPGDSRIFWTVGEDGRLLEFDLRKPHTCPAEEDSCNNVLANFSPSLPLKAISANPSNPDQLALACEDPFIRIVDRRMLHSYNGGGLLTPDVAHSSRHCTHILTAPGLGPAHHSTFVAFDESGQQLAANYHGQQIFTYDMTDPELSLAPLKFESPPIISTAPSASAASLIMSPRVARLKDMGNSAYKAGHYDDAITYYNTAILEQHGSEDHSILYSNRAAAFLRRRFVGDLHMAVADCERALEINPLNAKAMFRQLLALKDIGHLLQARRLLRVALLRFAGDKDFEDFGRDLAAAIEEKKRSTKAAAERRSARAEAAWREEREIRTRKLRRQRRKVPPTGLSGGSSGPRGVKRKSQGGDGQRENKQGEGEGAAAGKATDADGDAKMAESAPAAGVADDAGDAAAGLCEDDEEDLWETSLDSTATDDSEPLDSDGPRPGRPALPLRRPPVAPRRSRAFLGRFVGAANTQTDVKEVNFWRGFVLAGSDCGRVFVWDRRTGRLLKALKGSEQVVNCVRGHPYLPKIFSSGIDDHINVWAPGENEEKNEDNESADKAAAMESANDDDDDDDDLSSIASSNQHHLRLVNRRPPSRRVFDEPPLAFLELMMRQQGAELFANLRRQGGEQEQEEEEEDDDDDEADDADEE